MNPLRRTVVAVPVIVGVMVSCAPQSASQLTVFDPANYQENLLSSVRALEQINNQVRQLQAQAQMILRMDQNLLRLGSTISPDLQRTLGDIQTQLRAGEGIAMRLQATQSGYERLFPREVSASLSSAPRSRRPLPARSWPSRESRASRSARRSPRPITSTGWRASRA